MISFTFANLCTGMALTVATICSLRCIVGGNRFRSQVSDDRNTDLIEPSSAVEYLQKVNWARAQQLYLMRPGRG